MGTPERAGGASGNLSPGPESWLLRRREVMVDRTDMLSLSALRARGGLLVSVFSPGGDIKSKGVGSRVGVKKGGPPAGF